MNLFEACSKGNIDDVKHLIEDCKADIRIKNKDEQTCLFFSCENGHIETIKYLIEECKADINIFDKDGKTCLTFACANGHIETIKYLIEECKADINIKDYLDRTCLMCACFNGHIETIRYMVEECQADFTMKEKYGKTCLMYACLNGYIKAIRYLIEDCQADIQIKDKDGNTCLIYACLNGHIEVIKYLIEDCRVNINVMNKYGQTCLIYAYLNGHKEAIKYLIEESKADVNVKNIFGKTCLMYACLNGHLGIVRYLIKEWKANVKLKDNDGSTCLMYACLNGHIETIKYLIEDCQANINIIDRNDQTCLFYACQNGHKETVKYLIEECQTDTNIKDINNQTCLHITCHQNKMELLKYLLLRCTNVDLSARDKDGKRFYDYLSDKDHSELKERILLYVQSCKSRQSDTLTNYLHICGYPLSGKTILSHWIEDYFTSLFHLFDLKHDLSVELDRTRGMESKRISYKQAESGLMMNMIVHDYGGQHEFLVNHAQYLSVASSMYVIVLPLYNIKEKRDYTDEEIQDMYFSWLRFIFSVVERNEEIVKKKEEGEEPFDSPQLNGKSEEDSINSTKTLKQIPILTFINTFKKKSHWTKDNLDILNHHLLNLRKDYFENQTKPSDGMEFKFFEHHIVNIRSQKSSQASFKLFDEARKVIDKNIIHSTAIRLHLEKKLKETKKIPMILKKVEFKELLKEMLADFKPIQDLQRFPDSIEWVDSLVERSFLDLKSIGSILEAMNTSVSYTKPSEIIVTSPNWLTNEVFGQIFYHFAKSKSNIRSMVKKIDELNRMVQGLSDITASDLLKAAGLAIPVRLEGEQILNYGVEDDISQRNQSLLLLGLIEEKMTIGESYPLPIDQYDRQLTRVFALADQRYDFIPGYFMKLSVFLHNMEPLTIKSRFYINGINIKARKCFDNDQEYDKMIVIQPYENIDEGLRGFQIIIATNGAPKEDDFAMNDMNTLRTFLRSESLWNIELVEYCINIEPDNSYPMLLEKVEKIILFGSKNEKANVRDRYFGIIPRNPLKEKFLDQVYENSLHQTNMLMSYITREELFNKGKYTRSHSTKVLTEYDIEKIIEEKFSQQFENQLNDRSSEGITLKPLLEANIPHVEAYETMFNAFLESFFLKLRASNATIQTNDSNLLYEIIHKLEQLDKNMNEIRKFQVDSSSGVYDIPLLVQLDQPEATTTYGHIKRTVKEIFQLHFLCPICLQNKEKKSGYRVEILKIWAKDLLQVIHVSFVIIETALKIGGIPNQLSLLSEIAKKAMKGIEYIKDLPIGGMLFDKLNEYKDQLEEDLFSENVKFSEIILNQEKKSEFFKELTTKKIQIDQTYIDSMKKLVFSLDDPSLKESGLVRIVCEKKHEIAWVCKHCVARYKQEGNESLMIQVSF